MEEEGIRPWSSSRDEWVDPRLEDPETLYPERTPGTEMGYEYYPSLPGCVHTYRGDIIIGGGDANFGFGVVGVRDGCWKMFRAADMEILF